MIFNQQFYVIWQNFKSILIKIDIDHNLLKDLYWRSIPCPLPPMSPYQTNKSENATA